MSPRAVQIDFTRWPLLTASLDEDPGEGELAALVEGIQSALARRAPFALVIVAAHPLLGRDAHDAAPLRWLRRRRAEVGTWCRGVAYVIAGELESKERHNAERAAGLLWGCPVHITEEPNDREQQTPALDAQSSGSATGPV